MEHILSGASFFDSSQPAAVALPHLVTALDAELIGKVQHLTGCRPGLWALPAPFDSEDRFDNMRESAPFDAWGLPLNQGEVLSFSPLVQEAVFGSRIMFVDSEFDQEVLTRLATSPGRRVEGGAFVNRGYQDLPELAELVQQCRWVLIPLGPERGLALFAVGETKRDWILKLEEWCDHDGRSHGRFRVDENGLRLVLRSAPENYRKNAIGHQIDLFLSRIETHFGSLEQSLASLVEARIEKRRQLREQIAAAKQSTPPA